MEITHSKFGAADNLVIFFYSDSFKILSRIHILPLKKWIENFSMNI
jgi:hypothetical protein